MSATKDFTRYYNALIIKLVRQLKEARETRTALRSAFQGKLYATFSQDYQLYLSLVKTTAEFDCLLSLARASQNMSEPAVRPEFIESDRASVEFEELRHPCVPGVNDDFIPNDVSLGGKKEKLMLLTG